jgi:sodium transport system permease protein
VVYPVLIAGMTELTAAATLSLKARTAVVAVSGDLPPDVVKALAAAPRMKMVTSSDAETAVREHEVNVALLVKPAASPKGDPTLVVLLDAAEDESRTAAERVEDAIKTVRDARLTQRLEKLGVEEEYIHPLPLQRRNTSTRDRMSAYAASRMLPFLLIVLSLTGATATAVDITAGERERGTLLTLMATPVRAAEVAAAKLITVATVAMFAGLANLLALSLTLASVFSRASDNQFNFSPDARFVLGAVLALIPTALYGAALLLGLAALGKTTKEAQSSTAPALFLALGLAAITVAPGVKANLMLNSLPITGPALLMRDLIMGEATATQVLTVLCASGVALWIMVAFAARVLMSEPMLSAHLSTTAVIREMGGDRRPTTLTASMLAGLLLACTVYAGPALQSRNFALGLLATQVLFVVLTFGLLRLLRLDVVGLTGLRAPPLNALLAALLLGVSVIVPISLAEHWLVQVTGMQQALEDLQQGMKGLLHLDMGYARSVALVGVLPGLMEELAFRGALMGVLLKVTTPRRALWIQAAVFALAHLSAIRFPPTLALGLLLGLLRLRSGSVVPGMLMHGVHNSLIAVLMVLQGEFSDGAGDVELAELDEKPMLAAVAAALCMGAWMLYRTRPGEKKESATA